jgi:hypothetical protein
VQDSVVKSELGGNAGVVRAGAVPAPALTNPALDLYFNYGARAAQRNVDIIKDTTPILQFWSEMQQTWHIYSQRPQNSETGINFFILFTTVPFRAPQKRRFLGTYSGHGALTSRYFLRATSVKLVHVLNKNFCLKGFPIS